MRLGTLSCPLCPPTPTLYSIEVRSTISRISPRLKTAALVSYVTLTNLWNFSVVKPLIVNQQACIEYHLQRHWGFMVAEAGELGG